jgi:small-conductance mechanosensitive channel
MKQLMERLITTLQQQLGLDPVTTVRLFFSLLVILLFLGSRKLFDLYANRRIEDANKRHMAIKTVHHLSGLIALIIIGIIWFGGSTGLAAYLGILSAGLAIALQDPLVNIAGWMFIVARVPFEVGDRIEIGEHAGDVIDIRLFQFSLMEIGNWVEADQSTGRIIHIPNGWAFKKTIANFSQVFNFIWNELPVTVTFESNWEKAKEFLTKIVNEQCATCNKEAARQIRSQIRSTERKYMILFKHLTPIVWTSVADHGVTLTVRYLCETRKRRSSSETMWVEILKAFAASDDIDLAYPTWRYYDNVQEGKPPHKPSSSPKGKEKH